MSTRSPGESVFTSAASQAPVPEDGKTTTGPEVLKTWRIPASTSRPSRANSGPRWSMVGWASARRIRSGTLVGPGICRKCRPLLEAMPDLRGGPGPGTSRFDPQCARRTLRLGLDLHLHGAGHLVVQLHRHLELAHGLDGLGEIDGAAIDGQAALGQRLGDVHGGDRPVELVLLPHLALERDGRL